MMIELINKGVIASSSFSFVEPVSVLLLPLRRLVFWTSADGVVLLSLLRFDMSF